MKELSPQYLSEFCTELSLLLQAGVPLGEGFRILRGEAAETRTSEKLLGFLADSLDSGLLLSAALEAAGGFSAYFLNMIRLGESTGKLERTFSALAVYYERRAVLSANIKRAVIYPLLLLVLITAVVVVIVTQVLPIFGTVFNQVGVQMSGSALALIRFGSALSSASVVLLAVLAGLVCAGILIYKIPAAKRAFTGFLDRYRGNRGLARMVAVSRFASAMSMALSSGLSVEKALSLSGKICGEASNMGKRTAACLERLEAGENLDKSLRETGIFSDGECRRLALGMKAGKTDTVMADIAKRAEAGAIDALDALLRRIEPTLVILLSLIVGFILLSVMLPLMSIMSSL